MSSNLKELQTNTLIKAKKSLGQNFLIDKNIISNIVSSLNINNEDTVIEIGPGTGLMTEKILEFTKNLIVVEIDNRAINVLKSKFENKIKIIEGDILDFDFCSLNIKKSNLKVIGNIPYYITGDIFFKLFYNTNYIHSFVLTIQKEVAQRLVAPINTKEYGILTLAANYCGNPKILFDISANCFTPKPKVTSSTIQIILNKTFDVDEFKKLMNLIKTAFNQRRKKISNSLKNIVFEKGDDFWNSIKDLRAENLTINDYLTILKKMHVQ